MNKNNVLPNKIIDEKSVSLKKHYITNIAGASSKKIGIVVSNSSCEVYSYDEGGLTKSAAFNDDEGKITDIRFCPKNDSLIYTSSSNGSIKSWDLRAGPKHTVKFEENPDTRQFIKPLNAFDISCDGRILSGGSELTEGDAYILFWDTRSKDLMGGYWNSHTDDIVQVKFNPTKMNKLITGSVDGLVNVFDICEKTEDDALEYSLNIDCAVDKINWISDELISCVTQNIDVQIWNTSSADQIQSISRENISEHLQHSNIDDCYVIDVHGSKNEEALIVTGSYDANRKCLDLIETHEKDLRLKSKLENNKQIIRCSHYDRQNDLLICGGESGILSMWSCSLNASIEADVEKHKKSVTANMKNLKLHRNKPY